MDLTVGRGEEGGGRGVVIVAMAGGTTRWDVGVGGVCD